jgi:tetratricopeptide (TPR) repeat protein/O-antigen ligase
MFMKKYTQHIYWFVLIFAPLAFGTTEVWSRTIMDLAVFLCGTLYFYEVVKRKRSFYHVPGLVPLLGLAGVMVVQMLPLPWFLVKLMSPATYGLYQETLGLTGPVYWMRLTVDLKATVLALVQFAAYGLFYVVSVQLLSDGQFLRRTVSLIVGFGAVLALFAIVQHYISPRTIYGIRESFMGNVFGPYVNRNHYAGLMIMLFPVAFGMMLHNKPRVSYESWREKIIGFFNYRTINIYLLLVLAMLLMGASVFVSLSRGAIVSLCASLLMMGGLMTVKLPRGKGERSKGLVVAAFFGVLLLSVGWFGWKPIFERFDHIRNPNGDVANSRLGAWQDSMGIIGSFPVVGTGAGTFFEAHKAYRQATAVPGFFVHAHNDYIEMAADQGVLSLGLFGAFLFSVFASLKVFAIRHERYSIYLYMGALTGLTAILMHCLVEFHLHVGANALYFFFVAALCVAAAHTRFRQAKEKTLLGRYRKAWIKPVFRIAAPVLLVLGGVLNIGAYMGEMHENNIMAIYERPELTDADYLDIWGRCKKARFYDPFEGRNYMTMADAEKELAKKEEAAAFYRKALQLNPMNGVFLQAAADLYGENNWNLELAEKFHQAALKYEGANPLIHANYGFWLMSQKDFEKGDREMQTAVALSPGMTRRFVGKMAGLELTYDELTAALPSMTKPYIDLGDYLVNVGQMDLALMAYETAAHNLVTEEEINPVWVKELYRFYIKEDLVDEAYRVVATGIARLPDESSLRYLMGTIYEKMEIPYRAVDEYEAALIRDPKNLAARRRLERLQVKSVGEAIGNR